MSLAFDQDKVDLRDSAIHKLYSIPKTNIRTELSRIFIKVLHEQKLSTEKDYYISFKNHYILFHAFTKWASIKAVFSFTNSYKTFPEVIKMDMLSKDSTQQLNALVSMYETVDEEHTIVINYIKQLLNHSEDQYDFAYLLDNHLCKEMNLYADSYLPSALAEEYKEHLIKNNIDTSSVINQRLLVNALTDKP